MPKKIEANTDVWVHLQLNECDILLTLKEAA